MCSSIGNTQAPLTYWTADGEISWRGGGAHTVMNWNECWTRLFTNCRQCEKVSQKTFWMQKHWGDFNEVINTNQAWHHKTPEPSCTHTAPCWPSADAVGICFGVKTLPCFLTSELWPVESFWMLDPSRSSLTSSNLLIWHDVLVKHKWASFHTLAGGHQKKKYF